MLAQNKTPQTNATINALFAIFFRFFMPIPPVKIFFIKVPLYQPAKQENKFYVYILSHFF